jgi:hypothetical protein
MEEKIKMISAASRVMDFKKQNPLAIDEEIFQDVSDYISEMGDIKDEKVKFYMVAAATKALQISKKDPKLTEKQVLRQVMEEIPNLISSINLDEGLE